MREKATVLEAALFISKTNLVAGTWGNVSLRSNGKVFITPSGVPYDRLNEEDIAVVDLETEKQIDGRLKASSEIALHIEIYRNFDEINAVVHFHSIYATAFASMRKPIPCYVEDQAQILGGDVKVAEYALPGTRQLALNAVKALKERYGALLANHGAVAVGRTMKEALTAAQVLEKSAHVALLVAGNGIPLNDEDIKLMRKNYLISYSKKLLEGEL